jgi:hypothetical protein
VYLRNLTIDQLAKAHAAANHLLWNRTTVRERIVAELVVRSRKTS